MQRWSPAHSPSATYRPKKASPHDGKPFAMGLVEEGVPERQQGVSLAQGISDYVVVLRR